MAADIGAAAKRSRSVNMDLRMSILRFSFSLSRYCFGAGGAVIRSIVDLPETFLTGDDQGRLMKWHWPGGTDPIDYSKHTCRVDAVAAGRMVW